MKNQILAMSTKQYQELKDKHENGSIFIAEIDGNDISDLNQFLKTVWKIFRFPNTGYFNYYAYLDWIRDLDWLKAEGYLFVIKNQSALMVKDIAKKKLVIDSLKNEVLPWWESGIEQFQVQGRAKSFNVYLVD
jgi:hypothetical protein